MKKIIALSFLFASFFSMAEEAYIYTYNGTRDYCDSTNPQDVMDCFYRDFGRDGYKFEPVEDGHYQLYSFRKGKWEQDGMWFFVQKYKLSCDAGKKESIGQINFTKIGDDIMPKNICYSNCEQEITYNSDVPVICTGKECSMFNVDLTSTGKVCIANIDGGHENVKNDPQDIPEDQRYKPCPANIGSYLKDPSECEAFPPKQEQPIENPENPENPVDENSDQLPEEVMPDEPTEDNQENSGGGGKPINNGNETGSNQSETEGNNTGFNGQNGNKSENNEGNAGTGEGEGEGEGEDEGNSISGGNCRSGTPPKCKGDAVQCYIAEQNFYQRCATQSIEDMSGQINQIDLGDGINFGSKQPTKGDFVGTFSQEVDVRDYISDIDDSGFFSAPQCMANTSFTVKGKKIEISWEYWCLFLKYIGYFIVALAYYRGLIIIGKGFE